MAKPQCHYDLLAGLASVLGMSPSPSPPNDCGAPDNHGDPGEQDGEYLVYGVNDVRPVPIHAGRMVFQVGIQAPEYIVAINEVDAA
jgi:hypothetical protein